jgi:GTP-binding protein
VDVAPLDGSDPVDAVNTIKHELEKFSPELAKRDRWLVLNKVDLLDDEEREQICNDIVQKLNWQGPVFQTAALSKNGTQTLMYKIMEYIEEKQIRPRGSLEPIGHPQDKVKDKAERPDPGPIDYPEEK